MNFLSPTILLGLPFLLAACQTVGTDPYSSAVVEKAGPGALATAPSRPQSYALTASADEDDLVAAALGHHPSLRATHARVTALEQSAIQARALPDPSASVGTGQMAETAAGEVVATVGVQQKIPFPGKRSTASLMILKRADAIRSELEVNELALAERVRMAYWDYYAARRTTSVVTDSRGSLLTLRETVQARVAANKADRQDLLRLENEITRLDQRLVLAEGRAIAGKASLNALLYRPSGAPLPAPKAGALRQFGSPSMLLSRAVKNHPEVGAAQARISAAEHGVRLAKLQKRPDFTAGVSWSAVSDDGLAPSANGRDQFMGVLGVTLPLWREKNTAAEREAAASLSAEQSALAATRSSLQQRIETAHASATAERATLSLYSTKLIPDSRQSFDLLVAGYQTETASFLDLIDGWRQLLNFRLEREENRARVGKADATLRFAAGLR